MSLLGPPAPTTEVSPPPVFTAHRSPLLKREMPGLDTLRGIAVLSVVAFHGLKWSEPRAEALSSGVYRLNALVAFGWLGVNLFFVLSGFLITGILIDTRTRPNYWRSFYTRRVLRIVPLYLLTLITIRLALGVTWAYLLLCLFYLANFATQFKVAEGYGPLWSLAVEEQFYLVWPILVRRLRLKALAFVCLGSIVLSPFLRSLAASGMVRLGSPYSTTWLITDNLAVGALIAIVLRSPMSTRIQIPKLTLALGLAGMVLLGIGLRWHLLSRGTSAGALLQFEPFLLLFASMLLLALQFGDHPAILRLSRPLRFYGYISYGLYLLHILGFSAYDAVTAHFHPPTPQLTAPALLLRFAIVLFGTTLVCYLLRRYFEEFFLRFKDRLVPYTADSTRTQ